MGERKDRTKGNVQGGVQDRETKHMTLWAHKADAKGRYIFLTVKQ